MDHEFKGGNSRILGRMWDHFDLPLAILDRQGQIVFVNAAMCAMCSADATTLVGKTVSWQIAADSPLAAMLTALAPPAAALDGRASVRRLLTPVIFGSAHTGQLFIPLKNNSDVVQWTLTVFGEFQRLQAMMPTDSVASSRPQPDRTLLQIRSRWKTLDGLTALLGSSPTAKLAMQRCQLALQQNCNLLITGPAGVGKHDIAQAVFLNRLKSAGLNANQGQCFPIDCRKLDADLVDSLLEIFAGRLRNEAPLSSQQLILTGIDQLTEPALKRVLVWLDQIYGHATVVGTSSQPAAEFFKRGSAWQELISRVAAVEIYLPGLSQRREDIAPLAVQALAEACQAAERAQLTLSSDALHLLEAFSWPNNVRQLVAAMQEAVKAAVLTSAILPNHLPVAIRTFPGSVAESSAAQVQPVDLDVILLDVEKIMIRRALKLSPRNRAQAARLLSVSRPRLLRRIEQLGLNESTPNLIEDDEEPNSNTEPQSGA
jgi:transcriptional regulator with PAS, ATPase and Fis domain